MPKWYGYVFGAFFVLYGGVKIILGALDRQYDGVGQFILFLLIGVAVFTVAFGYRDGRVWGWYGLVTVNALIVVLTLFGLSDLYNVIFLILSAATLGLLFMPTTKSEVFLSRQN